MLDRMDRLVMPLIVMFKVASLNDFHWFVLVGNVFWDGKKK